MHADHVTGAWLPGASVRALAKASGAVGADRYLHGDQIAFASALERAHAGPH